MTKVIVIQSLLLNDYFYCITIKIDTHLKINLSSLSKGIDILLFIYLFIYFALNYF